MNPLEEIRVLSAMTASWVRIHLVDESTEYLPEDTNFINGKCTRPLSRFKLKLTLIGGILEARAEVDLRGEKMDSY
jgi:hypothetical protein